jgi:hypothetical protein
MRTNGFGNQRDGSYDEAFNSNFERSTPVYSSHRLSLEAATTDHHSVLPVEATDYKNNADRH